MPFEKLRQNRSCRINSTSISKKSSVDPAGEPPHLPKAMVIQNDLAALLRHFLERKLCLLHGVVARGRATISGRLDDDLLQFVRGEVALG